MAIIAHTQTETRRTDHAVDGRTGEIHMLFSSGVILNPSTSIHHLTPHCVVVQLNEQVPPNSSLFCVLPIWKDLGRDKWLKPTSSRREILRFQGGEAVQILSVGPLIDTSGPTTSIRCCRIRGGLVQGEREKIGCIEDAFDLRRVV